VSTAAYTSTRRLLRADLRTEEDTATAVTVEATAAGTARPRRAATDLGL